MPTYGYECLSCPNQFETFQSIKDNPLTTCDACGGSLRKRVYPVGIAFKGSGFYVNDYAPKSGAKAETSKADALAVTADAVPAADTKSTDTKTADVPAPKAEKNPPPTPPAAGREGEGF